MAQEQAILARTPELRAVLLAWYRATRRTLPWRETKDPYAVWLSEIMLQQTRVDTVIPYYQRFLRRFPSVHRLADAPLDDVIALWSGLGYYRRARMLHDAARQIARDHGGELPKTARELLGICGIGRYTAGAVASIAFGEPTPLVDGNVARVLARVFAIQEDVSSSRGVAHTWRLAEALVRPDEPGDWNQALMELGATVCLPRGPRCSECPASPFCAARDRGLTAVLPRAKSRAPARVERRVALVVRHRGRVLLGRRRADARFGATWEPPSFESARGESFVPVFARVAGAAARRVERRGVTVHVLSHRRLEVEVYTVELRKARAPSRADLDDYDAWEWVARGDLGDRGISTFARKVIERALAEVATGPRRRHRQKR